jgi:hypothetical protein
MNTFFGIGSDRRYSDQLVELMSSADIPDRWRGTPIEQIIQALNFGYPLHPQLTPCVLIVSCMEFRFSLPIPANYGYVIRTPGGRLTDGELAVGYVLSKGVSNILLIAHNDCGMTHLTEQSAAIVRAFVGQGWPEASAANFVKAQIEKQGIVNELEAQENEYHRLKKLFKKVHVAPLFLTLEDKKVYLPRWYVEFIAADGH